MNFCPNCGTRITHENDLFCLNCGVALPGGVQQNLTRQGTEPLFQAVVGPAGEPAAAPFGGAQAGPLPRQVMQPAQQEDLLSLLENPAPATSAQATPEAPPAIEAALPEATAAPPPPKQETPAEMALFEQAAAPAAETPFRLVDESAAILPEFAELAEDGDALPSAQPEVFAEAEQAPAQSAGSLGDGLAVMASEPAFTPVVGPGAADALADPAPLADPPPFTDPAPLTETPAVPTEAAEPAPAETAIPAAPTETVEPAIPDLFADAQPLSGADLFAGADAPTQGGGMNLFAEAAVAGPPRQLAPQRAAPQPAPQHTPLTQVYRSAPAGAHSLFEQDAGVAGGSGLSEEERYQRSRQDTWQQQEQGFGKEEWQQPPRQHRFPAGYADERKSRASHASAREGSRARDDRDDRDRRRQSDERDRRDERNRRDEHDQREKQRRPAPRQEVRPNDGYDEPEAPARRGRPAHRSQAELSVREPRQRSLGGSILTFIMVVLLFAVLLGGTVMVMLYFNNRPAKVVDAFTVALANGDIEGLEELAKIDGATTSEEGWRAFIAAFARQTDLNTLKAQLLMEAENPKANAPATYPAVTIESRPFILFLEKYNITIKGVQLLAPGAAAGSVAWLDEREYVGAGTAEGELFSGLMPGRYQYRLAAPGTDAAGIAPIEITIFETDGPNVPEAGEVSRADVTVENCLLDDATLYVNDMPVEQKPVQGVVSIPGVSLGSTIRIELTYEDQRQQASVVFDNLAATALRFENYAPIEAGDGGGEEQPPEEDSEAVQIAKNLSESDINAVLVIFYRSYLDAINAQDIEAIKLTTSGGKTFFAERIQSTGNKANNFEYESAGADAATLEAGERDGTPRVTLTANFRYRYKPREGEGDWAEASNKQTVELLYENGQWVVNRMEFVS